MKIYFIPNGPRNLSTMFPGIDFSTIGKYYIEVQSTGAETIATGTINHLDGECCEDKVRIRFLNYLGTIDGINFKKVTDEHSASSDTYQKSTSHPLVKSAHTRSRTNVRANNTLTLSCIDYREEDMPWTNELVDSPLAWIECAGTQGQDDDYIPVLIADTKILNQKPDNRFEYETMIQVTLSNEKFIIRN